MTAQTPGQKTTDEALRKIAQACVDAENQLATDAAAVIRNVGEALSQTPLAVAIRRAEAAAVPAPRRRWWHRLLWWRKA